MAYDSVGNLIEDHHIDQNPWGQETERSFANQLHQHSHYDPQGRLCAQIISPHTN